MSERQGFMQAAVSLKSEQRFRDDFEITRELPENLRALERISRNFYWSWAGGTELFREIEPSLWERCEQNPRLFLKRVGQFRLWQKSLDYDFIQKLDRFESRMNDYLAQPAIGTGRISAANPANFRKRVLKISVNS